MLKLNEIQMRDPFVLRHDPEGRYYLYGSTDPDIWKGKAIGFDVYCSRDLEHWEGPYPAFRPDADFWSDRNYWAPEVHAYRGRYYMFATLWSSFRNGRYAQGLARSPSGKIAGPWIQRNEPIYESDGGHGMLFETFEGELMLALHTPNRTPLERPVFLRLREDSGGLGLAGD
ncbi:family 43 glycosylhydrolase [Paenibacillaceae bacterium WGS1546]|uniref:family 43 glycosylhydrolase n=1 Tax=Cohnella sp. WGS1546 TaxID=3366810 RepID=UPI00372D79EB